jgi:probable rRNA maturation factor
MIRFEVNQQSGKNISKAIWTKWVNKINKALKIGKNLEISIGIVGENEIKNLNRMYRGKNKVTDVLSFGEIDQKEKDFTEEEPGYIGEIVICYNQAARQAKILGHSIEKEIELLFIHGFLHLLGHDHEKNPKAADVMRKLEAKILEYGINKHKNKKT